MPRVLANAVLRPLLQNNHDGYIYLAPMKFGHNYQNLWHVRNEKPIESSTRIHSVAQALTKEKENDKRMDRRRRVTETVRKGKRENGKG